MVVYRQGRASSTAAGCGIPLHLARPVLTAAWGGGCNLEEMHLVVVVVLRGRLDKNVD